MAIDSLNILMKKKSYLKVKEICDSFTLTLKHLTDSDLNLDDIKSRFTIFKANP